MSGDQIPSTALSEAISNDNKLYEGDMTHYGRVHFHHVQNLTQMSNSIAQMHAAAKAKESGAGQIRGDDGVGSR